MGSPLACETQVEVNPEICRKNSMGKSHVSYMYILMVPYNRMVYITVAWGERPSYCVDSVVTAICIGISGKIFRSERQQAALMSEQQVTLRVGHLYVDLVWRKGNSIPSEESNHKIGNKLHNKTRFVQSYSGKDHITESSCYYSLQRPPNQESEKKFRLRPLLSCNEGKFHI